MPWVESMSRYMLFSSLPDARFISLLMTRLMGTETRTWLSASFLVAKKVWSDTSYGVLAMNGLPTK